MPKFFTTLIITAISMIIASFIIPGILVSTITAALIGALIFGLVNAIVRPILILLTLPATVLTLGLFLLVVNAICFSLVAYFTPGFTVNGFFDALLGSIIVSLVSGFFNNQVSSD